MKAMKAMKASVAFLVVAALSATPFATAHHMNVTDPRDMQPEPEPSPTESPTESPSPSP